MTTAVLDTTPLNAHDRCDRCGAQAQMRAVLTTGELLFCGHHSRLHHVALTSQAVRAPIAPVL